jgi:hypothetical protein
MRHHRSRFGFVDEMLYNDTKNGVIEMAWASIKPIHWLSRASRAFSRGIRKIPRFYASRAGRGIRIRTAKRLSAAATCHTRCSAGRHLIEEPTRTSASGSRMSSGPPGSLPLAFEA